MSRELTSYVNENAALLHQETGINKEADENARTSVAVGADREGRPYRD
jgi:hypothetical protein